MENYYFKSLSRLPPKLRRIYSMGIIKRRIFVHGGKSCMSILLDEFWQYDIHLKSWLNIYKEDSVKLRSNSSEIAVVDVGVYLIWCEDSPFSYCPMSIGYYDSEKNKWELLTHLQGIHADNNFSLKSMQSMFHYNNSLYVIAERKRDLSSNLILKYSLMEKSWSAVEQKGELLKVMMGISGSVFDNKYYCFGDMMQFKTNIYHDIHIFDLKTYTWSHKETYPDFDQYPPDRIYASISFSETHGFLSGGQSDLHEILDDLWCIDLQTLKWHKLNFKLRSKIMRHKSAVYDESTLFIFGGLMDIDRANQLQKYVIEPPPLYKLCLYVFMKGNNEESKLQRIPPNIRQDIISPQTEFLLSEETDSNIEGINHSGDIVHDE